MAETTKEQPAKKAPAKKRPASKTSAPREESAEKRPVKRTAKASTEGQPPKKQAPEKSAPKGMQAALQAAQQLVALTGKEFEGIVGMAKSDDGWTVQVEVLELRRIPDTTDVLAIYEVSLDGDGDLVGYRRTDRYVRGSAGEDRQ